MGAPWPPSPFVEEAEAALSHEHGLEKRLQELKVENQPAGSRGSLNQYPIILEVDLESLKEKKSPSKNEHDAKRVSPENKETPTPNNKHDSVHSQSSDESLGPPTPSTSNPDRRYVYIPAKTSDARSPSPPGLVTPPSGRPQNSSNDETPRGRPTVSRLQTDLEAEAPKDVGPGRGRAPSLYSYKPAELAEKAGNRFSGEFLLSPDPTTPMHHVPIIDTKRPSSARPRLGTEVPSAAADSGHHHSRRRSTRESFGKSSRPPLSSGVDQVKRSASYAYPRQEPSMLSKGLHSVEKGSHSDPTSRQEKRLSRESSSYSSSADEAKTRGQPVPTTSQEKRLSRESPYTSSAEDSKSRHHNDDHARRATDRKTHRSSMNVQDRPHLDLSSHRYSYGGSEISGDRHESRKHRHESKHHSVFDGRNYLERPAGRSAHVADDYIEEALNEAKARNVSESPRVSPGASPIRSPPQTPPRTPRSDRRSKDYFSISSSVPHYESNPTKSRPSSRSETHHPDLRPLTATIAAATAGVATTKAAAGMPHSSNSSSGELRSSRPSSNQSVGRKSRPVSPATDELRPGSKSGACAPHADRPGSNSSSGHTNEDRPVSRSGSYIPTPLHDSPHLNQRSYSYSAHDEHPYFRPGHTKRPSKISLTPITVTEATSTRPATRGTRSSPSSERPARLPQLSPGAGGLPQCSRPEPIAGHNDWYTITGMTELEFCPTCMTMLRSSRVRDYFIPSPRRAPTDRVQCALSRPWIRNAWIQGMKQHRNPLDLIYRITHIPPLTRPCPGKRSEVRSWYRIIDPRTGHPVPNFDACSECVRAVDILFPQLEGTFHRSSSLVQDRTCDLNSTSKRFAGYINHLDAAATRYDVERLRKPDVQAFADHARRVSSLRECSRDDMIVAKSWYFMPQLPEFTVCEECFHEVVGPVIDKPVARNFNRTLQTVPWTRDGQHMKGISCQLYSERMRRKFFEAVSSNDFEFLKQIALRRRGVEKLLQEKQKLIMRDIATGKDRTADLQGNIEEWRIWE